jgi:hypothetical protein
MDYPVCLGCLRCIYPPGCTLAVDSRSICTCVRPIRAQITFTTGNSTSTPVDWVKQLQIMRVWKVTLHGRIDGQKQTVPDAFQDAFKDGELEL